MSLTYLNPTFVPDYAGAAPVSFFPEGVIFSQPATNWADSESAAPIANLRAVQQLMPTAKTATVFMNGATYHWIRLLPRYFRRIGRKINRRQNRSTH